MLISGKNVTVPDLLKAEADVKADPIYGPEGEIIKNALLKFPMNTDREIVAMKICLIDYTNSTNLAKFKRRVPLTKLVDIITGIKDFDQQVLEGKEELVENIALQTKEAGDNLFSFASKYCCYHNYYCYHRDDYSIFDRVLMNHLVDYDENANPKTIKMLKDECRYREYKDVITTILNRNHIVLANRRRLFDYLVRYYNKE